MSKLHSIICICIIIVCLPIIILFGAIQFSMYFIEFGPGYAFHNLHKFNKDK